jgi:ribonuclease P protein component
MLPPANRLRKEKEIKRALASRNGRKSGQLMCKTAENGLNTARFCFIVSKRVSNKAVVRNKLKRRLRAAVGVVLARVRAGVDCVMIAYPGLETKEYQELAMLVEKLLKLSGIISNQ